MEGQEWKDRNGRNERRTDGHGREEWKDRNGMRKSNKDGRTVESKGYLKN
jgi:hypothetical protein